MTIAILIPLGFLVAAAICLAIIVDVVLGPSPKETKVDGWTVAMVRCVYCAHHWVAVWPETMEGGHLECPGCGFMTPAPDLPVDDDDQLSRSQPTT